MTDEVRYPEPDEERWWVVCPDGLAYVRDVTRQEAWDALREVNGDCLCGGAPHKLGVLLDDGRVVSAPARKRQGRPGLNRCGLCHRDGHTAPSCPYRELTRT